MIYSQNTKKAVLFHASTTAAGTVSGTVDTLDFDYCTIDLLVPTSNTTSNNMSVCKIDETDDLTTYSAITALTGDSGWTIPSNSTAANQIITFEVDCRNRGRYLRLTCSPLTTQILSATATLSRAHESPSTIGEGGVAARVQG